MSIIQISSKIKTNINTNDYFENPENSVKYTPRAR